MMVLLNNHNARRILDMAHYNTLFRNLLQVIPGHLFNTLEQKHQHVRAPRKFSLKQQFLLMAFVQLANRRSLRDALRCLCSAKSRLYHWGLGKLSRSTVADANCSRPYAYFEDLFAAMYQRCLTVAPKHKFRFKSKLYSMDATIISLCLSIFPWATFRKNKAGVKLNTVLDHNGHIPAFISISQASTHDSKMIQCLNLAKGSIVTFDKGFCDYTWFKHLDDKGIYLVTRMKNNAVYKLIKRNAINKGTGITSDHIIQHKTKIGCLQLRRIGYRDPATGKHYIFLSNNFKLSAKTIADIYQQRWQIELFFKELKQNLRIKSFVGRSQNAVLIQIYTALTVYLLLAYLKFLCKIKRSVQQIVELVQINLLANATLIELLKPKPPQHKMLRQYSFLTF